jgi:hypothetical protein
MLTMLCKFCHYDILNKNVLIIHIRWIDCIIVGVKKIFSQIYDLLYNGAISKYVVRKHLCGAIIQ